MSGATVGLLDGSEIRHLWSSQGWIKALELIGAIACLAGLVYTLFFALPVGSYADDGRVELVDRGIYALCRHPGVWWLGLFYLLVWLWCEQTPILWGGLLFTALDILYVYWQDRWVFEKSIEGYAEYKSRTPFLIPSGGSIRRCFYSRSS